MKEIHFYKELGDLGYLANYSEYGFTINDVYYKTVEHFYQSSKFDNAEIKEKIINAKDAHEAAEIGRDRNNIRTTDFNKIKLDVMRKGVYEKFKQNREILYKLIETRTYKIFEDTLDEYYWGIGTLKTGENNIGKILESVRDQLRIELRDDIIKKLKGKEVYVIGHKNPDADAIFSSFLLNKIFNKLKIKSNFCILDNEYNYDEADKKLIAKYLETEPIIVKDVTNKNFILVDHNDPIQSVENAVVLASFDHHKISKKVYDTIEMEYASTGLLIYDLFKDIYKFTKKEKTLIALTVLTDTSYLTSARFSELDKALYEELNVNLNASKIQKDYFVTTDFTKDIKTNILSNYKTYELDNTRLNRTIISSLDNINLAFYKEYIKNMKGTWLLIWNNYSNNTTYIYLNVKDYEYIFNKIITSTNLLIKYLEENKVI